MFVNTYVTVVGFLLVIVITTNPAGWEDRPKWWASFEKETVPKSLQDCVQGLGIRAVNLPRHFLGGIFSTYLDF